MTSEKKIRDEILENQNALKKHLVELYEKIQSGSISDGEREQLESAVREIKEKLEPKTRTVCKRLGIPEDSDVIRLCRSR